MRGKRVTYTHIQNNRAGKRQGKRLEGLIQSFPPQCSALCDHRQRRASEEYARRDPGIDRRTCQATCSLNPTILFSLSNSFSFFFFSLYFILPLVFFFSSHFYFFLLQSLSPASSENSRLKKTANSICRCRYVYVCMNE